MFIKVKKVILTPGDYTTEDVWINPDQIKVMVNSVHSGFPGVKFVDAYIDEEYDSFIFLGTVENFLSDINYFVQNNITSGPFK